MTSPRQPMHELDGKPAIRFGDAIALLDVAGDAYSCIYDPIDQADAHLPDTRSAGRDSVGAPLEDARIFGRWRSLPDADASVRLSDIGRFAAALSVAAIHFHRRDFAALLGSGGARPTRPDVPSDDLAIVIARFERMALFLPVPILCLFRSFFLLRFLASYGYAADWVFGVTLFPFRAHCWLASGDLLLGEVADRATSFSPILVIEAPHP